MPRQVRPGGAATLYDVNVAKTSPVDRTSAEVVALLRRYLAEDLTTRRTEILKEIGERIVDLRELYQTAAGEPDWSGKTHPYKMRLSDIYSDAALGDRRTSVQTAVRYHVNNALRARLTPEELEDLGLMTVSARERSVEHRADKAALLSAMRPGASDPAPVDPLQAVTSAHVLLRRVQRRPVKALSERRHAAMLDTLDKINAEVDRLRDAAGG